MKLTLPGQLWPLRGTISAVGPGISDMIYIDVLHKSSHSELTWGVFWSELECSMSVRCFLIGVSQQKWLFAGRDDVY